MTSRLKASFWAMLIALDVLLCTIWLSTLYPLGWSERPTGRQLVSAYVGGAKLNGHRWARITAAVIDWGAARLGDSPNHCVRAYRRYGDQ